MIETKELNSVIGSQGIEANSNFDETLKNADLDWEVKDEKAGGMDTGISIPRKKLLFRSDNNEFLGLVGDDYKASCPRAFAKSQFELAEAMDGKVNQIGFVSERSKAFAFINIGEINVRSPKTELGDPLRAFIYSTDGWDGGTPRKSRLYIERLACLNGQVSRLIEATAWVSHTQSMEVRAERRWSAFRNEVKETLGIVTEQFEKLAATPMKLDEMQLFAERLIPGKSSLSVNRRDTITNLFANGRGNAGASRWDAYNAVTEYVTHHRNYRTSGATGVNTNRFLGVLETDKLADAALGMLAG
jgi:hypothetical protein